MLRLHFVPEMPFLAWHSQLHVSGLYALQLKQSGLIPGMDNLCIHLLQGNSSFLQGGSRSGSPRI